MSLLVVVLFAGGFFYYTAMAVCPTPLTYRVGDIDERFDLSFDEAKLAVAGAENVWEDATGKNLFSYDDEADFTVNFVFDERQALLNAEDDFKERLDVAEGVNENIAAQYEELVEQYETLKKQYESEVESYESRLNDYNQEVKGYNEAGGAPKDEYDRLEREKDQLDDEQEELNRTAGQLNGLIDQINELGEEGNRIIDSYNRGVDVYNNTFGDTREFTQGDYQGDRINIYTFEDETELELVLTHELGHALHLGHVAGEQSVMYYLIGEQPTELDLTAYDLEEFNRVCGEDVSSVWERIKISFGYESY